MSTASYFIMVGAMLSLAVVAALLISRSYLNYMEDPKGWKERKKKGVALEAGQTAAQ